MYTIKQQTQAQKEIYDNLVNDGYSSLTAYSLSLRNYDRAEKMLPYLSLSDIDKCVDYLYDAIKANKKMCVVADYDVDGATSCSIMVSGLRTLGADIVYFVPNRFKHGYGLQASVIDDMLMTYPDIDVIITVDNGIASVSGVDYANSKNIDVVVTDHHLEGDERPNAVVIVNPNKKDCQFESKALAGCGVAFYVVLALREKIAKLDNKKFNISYLQDYLAIGTVADVVTLDGNNRLLVEYGLNRIKNHKANIGVQALIDVLGINQDKINTSDIAFQIAPTLNAAGRIEDMSKGINLLLSNNYEYATELAIELVKINKTRKSIENTMKEDALEQIDIANSNSDDLFSCCVQNKDFHEGVIGILASRIKELLYVPTIVFSELEELEQGRAVLKGSGRSIEGLHLRDAIDYVTKKVPDCVIKFGGHAMAAGLTIYKDKFDDFKFYLNEYCKEIFKNVKPTNVVSVDKELDLKNISIDDVEELNSQIWGQHFTEPVFIADFKINKQELLSGGKHLKVWFDYKGMKIVGLWFFRTEFIDVEHNENVKVIFKLNINEWRNKKEIQIYVQSLEA
jgi:single-stranded-DNA-specific exonuclease recJ